MCLYGHAIPAVRAIKSIMKDTIVLSVRFAAILNWRFSENCLFAFFTYLGRGGHLVDAYIYTPRGMFRILSVTCLLTREALRLIIFPD